MKILMLTPYLPYPTNSGGQIRSNNLIKKLSEKHEITLCALIKNPADSKYLPYLEKYCKKIYLFPRPAKPWTIENILKTGFSLYPFLVMRNFSPLEKKALVGIIKQGNFDLIHCETFYTYPHLPSTNLPVVLVDQTLEYKAVEHYVKGYKYPFLKPLLYYDVFKLKYWETYFWKKATELVAVSEPDARFMEYVTQKKVTVVANGVGDDFIEDIKLHFNKTILFQGNYQWLQNGEAAEILVKKVFPLVLEKIPDAKVIISGQYTHSVKHLESSHVEVRELAPDDVAGVQQTIRGAGVMVAPLYGPGGARLKILSSMAARLPVVTTHVGIAGIGQSGVNFLEGDTPEQLASQTIKILTDKKLYEKITTNARELVERDFSYESLARQLEQVYRKAISK